MNTDHTLERLTDISCAAYQVARAEVYDTLPAGMRLDPSTLTHRQCQVLMEVRAAEAAVAAYRQSQYEPSFA